MVNQRNRIRLDDEELRQLLVEGRHLQVASIAPDGRPHLVPMWYVLDEDGAIVFTTYAKSQKVLNLQRDPRVTALLEAGAGYDELRGVMIEGLAEVVADDPAATAAVMARVGAKYRPAGEGEPSEASRRSIPAAAYKRAVVRIRPQQLRSWDHRRLR